MKLFSEIYSIYYRIAEEILKRKKVTKNEIRNIIQEKGFLETVLFLEPKITGSERYSLFCEEDGIYSSVLKKSPDRPLTLLEKKWLCAVLNDRRSALFLDKEVREELSEVLGVTPMFLQSDFYSFDKFADGDPYEDEKYISHFRNICTAVKNKCLIKISFQSAKGNRITHYFLPLKIEYSAKNDKFRVHVTSYKNKKPFESGIINISSVTLTEITDIYPEIPENLSRKCREPIVVRVSKERNAINRFMMEFAELERTSVFDEETGICTVSLWYNKYDETEIVIRLLSFGPVIEVVSPSCVRRQMRQRVLKQKEILEQSEIIV